MKLKYGVLKLSWQLVKIHLNRPLKSGLAVTFVIYFKITITVCELSRKDIPKNELQLEQEITKHLLKINYESTVRPPIYELNLVNQTGHNAVIVKINLFIMAFSSISVGDNDFTLDMMVRQTWVDKRLYMNQSFESLSIGYLKSKLWTPDLFFRNSKKSSTHSVTKPNHMIWLYPDGTLKFSQKLTVTSFCEMNLWNFPLDTQTCFMQLGSYGYPIEDLKFDWWNYKDKHIFLNEPMNLNEFYQPDISTFYCQSNFELTGNFSCLQVNFILKRKFGFYLIYTYLPSIFIVSISWVAFFIDHRAVPARITLGLLALLALMTQSSAVVEKLPKVSYVKAIDVWMFTCLAFVIISLFEFTVVNCLSRSQDKNKFRNELRQVVKNELMILGTTGPKRNTVSSEEESNNRFSQFFTEENSEIPIRKEIKNKNLHKMKFIKAHQLDRLFSIWFPIIFIIFNLIYWFIYNRP